MRRPLAALGFGVMLVMAAGVFAGKGEGAVIEKGRKVSFDYALTVDGQVVDSSQGRGPLQYTHGDGKIIPGLSRQLEGMQVGDEREIVVAPAEAYGDVDPHAFEEVPKSRLPQGDALGVGTQLQATSSDGQMLLVTVSEVKGDTVRLNFNHPLAGKELRFQVKIVDIQ